MELRLMLRNGFEYDLWANRKWIDALGGFDRYLGRAQEVLEHIHLAQTTWLMRCGMEMFPPQENLALRDLFEITTRSWQALIEEMTGEEEVTYQNFAGETFTNTVAQISYHVINHGTYHRGQLRGLAEADGYLGFPETDLIAYLRQRDKS